MANSTEKMPIINSWGKALYVTKVHRQHSGAKVVFSAEGARTIGHPLAKKSKSTARSYTLHKNQFKIDHRPKCKIQNY